jgi:hypothetical protein
MKFGAPREIYTGTILYKLHTNIDGQAVGIEKCVVLGESGPGIEDGKRISGRWTTWDISGEKGNMYHPYTHHCMDGFFFEYDKAVAEGLEKSKATLDYFTKQKSKASKAYNHFKQLAKDLK